MVLEEEVEVSPCALMKLCPCAEIRMLLSVKSMPDDIRLFCAMFHTTNVLPEAVV